ncbi:hypothetical protein PUR34_02335 [Streptomyces sp. JV185]|uniref:hypothetical protein n=1 Tax=Streptomyces sp. JV185 TaxID=858638 RepID=UPI002E7855E8|nr:hypothetical protein [Streptomyces sp. JV185]MEE1767059.1 hypothetical protein [Streptomyces sp. JV185]
MSYAWFTPVPSPERRLRVGRSLNSTFTSIKGTAYSITVSPSEELNALLAGLWAAGPLLRAALVPSPSGDGGAPVTSAPRSLIDGLGFRVPADICQEAADLLLGVFSVESLNTKV